MRNSKLIVSAAAAVSAMLGIGVASAADLPMKAMPHPAPVPVFSWTGCYIGVHGGGGVMNDTNTEDYGGGSAPGGHIHGTGGVAGGQVGCNYQMTNWVFGVEGEGYWSGMKGTYDSSYNEYNNNGSLYYTDFTHNQTQNKSDFTIAGRMGVAFDRTLIYGKAGWAWGKFDVFDNSGTNYSNCNGSCSPNNLNHYSYSGTLNGPLFGLGIEYAFTQNWTAKLEYNYIMFGANSFANTHCYGQSGSPTVCQAYGNTSLSADKQLFKFGVNYKFDWGAAPVIAKY